MTLGFIGFKRPNSSEIKDLPNWVSLALPKQQTSLSLAIQDANDD